jgi:hypothetical protein
MFRPCCKRRYDQGRQLGFQQTIRDYRLRYSNRPAAALNIATQESIGRSTEGSSGIRPPEAAGNPILGVRAATRQLG